MVTENVYVTTKRLEMSLTCQIELFPPPAPPPPTALSSPLGTVLSRESGLPQPPPAQTPLSHPATSGQQPVYNREVCNLPSQCCSKFTCTFE